MAVEQIRPDSRAEKWFGSRRKILYQRPHPMTVFCDGIGRKDQGHARVKRVIGQGRWY